MTDTPLLEKEIRRLSKELENREAIETIILRHADEALKNFRWTPPKRKERDTRKIHSETAVIHISDR